MSKALLINSEVVLGTGTEQGSWSQMTQASTYIRGIQTGDILDDADARTLNAIISGIPTPWARAKLFKYALDSLHKPDPSVEAKGLTKMYQMLHGEWRGLLAVMALYPDRISFSKPVVMDTLGGDYDIAAAFGRMLFDDRDVWSDQKALAKNPGVQPYLHLIYYRSQLVGGTSPFTGVFTGVDYSGLGNTASDIPWYRNGKFEDPMRYLIPQQIQKVYLFVKNLASHAQQFEADINSQRGNKPGIKLGGFKAMIQKWEAELKAKGSNLREKGPVAQYGSLRQPFADLFDSKVPIYLKKDFTFSYTDDGNSETIGDIQELLSADAYVMGWAEPKEQRPKLADAPVYFLKVNDIKTGDTGYFSVPLSEIGIDIFKNNLGSILGYTDGGNTRLTAHLTDAGMLAVSLVVEIDGESVTLNDREYNIHWVQSQGRVIAWPNFVSDKWNRYYLFSEFSDGSQEHFEPIFRYNKEILKTIDGKFLTAKYEPIPEEKRQVSIHQLVKYPAGQGDDLPKYDIIQADKPFCGLMATVSVAGKPRNAGFLMMRKDVVKDLTDTPANLSADIGFDFGSNNTCVFYNAGDTGAQPVEFGNYRAVLVGRENNNPRAIAENNELLFFTNYPSENGQIKSWLHEHDSRYITYTETEEIAGGVPVNRPNVLVREMDKFKITTQAGVLHYNMKWLDGDDGKKKKGAFLKSVWLQACAFLYTSRISPKQIAWSFPGSMLDSDRNDLGLIYEALCNITPYGTTKPVTPHDKTTEAEAVCSYAMSKDFGLTSSNMFLGLDVGGSTTDIMLIAKDNNNVASLMRESSVRLAAGVFFDAVTKSRLFQEALISFHEGHKTDVYVENIHDMLEHPEKAPYFLNSIFDQLKTQGDYDMFYDSLASNAKVVFTIPAYVSGLLLFYSGMLIGKVIKDNNLGNIETVEIMPFGKGGRIFHWLRHAAGTHPAEDFYSDCLNAGLKLILPEKSLKTRYRDEIEGDCKTEVAQGLCAPRQLAVVETAADSDICGETGVTYFQNGERVPVAADEELTGDKFADSMGNFDFKDVCNFRQYMELFINFVSQRTNIYRDAGSSLCDDIDDLPTRIAPFCTADPEYRKATRNQQSGKDKGFHYHQPVIIAEGACFLESLVKKVFR